jgi:hypothetical protein
MVARLSFNIMSGLGVAQLSSVIFWRTLAGTVRALGRHGTMPNFGCAVEQFDIDGVLPRNL